MVTFVVRRREKGQEGNFYWHVYIHVDRDAFVHVSDFHNDRIQSF